MAKIAGAAPSAKAGKNPGAANFIQYAAITPNRRCFHHRIKLLLDVFQINGIIELIIQCAGFGSKQ